MAWIKEGNLTKQSAKKKSAQKRYGNSWNDLGVAPEDDATITTSAATVNVVLSVADGQYLFNMVVARDALPIPARNDVVDSVNSADKVIMVRSGDHHNGGAPGDGNISPSISPGISPAGAPGKTVSAAPTPVIADDSYKIIGLYELSRYNTEVKCQLRKWHGTTYSGRGSVVKSPYGDFDMRFCKCI
jgi:hypothetical protein